jgi:dihydroorotate dehydrogenase electron transfer subunit
MNNKIVTFAFDRQTPQANGYFLLETQLEFSHKLPTNLSFTHDTQKFYLFSHNQSSNKLQFLTNSKIELPFHKEIDLEHVWSGDDDSNKVFQKIKPHQTLCLLASENCIAQAFMLAKQCPIDISLSIILHSTHTFPFIIKPARFIMNDLPPEMIGCSELLEDWKIPNRLCSDADLAGCFDGNFQQLNTQWQPPKNWVIHLI